jgi:hypothetical protein
MPSFVELLTEILLKKWSGRRRPLLGWDDGANAALISVVVTLGTGEGSVKRLPGKLAVGTFSR